MAGIVAAVGILVGCDDDGEIDPIAPVVPVVSRVDVPLSHSTYSVGTKDTLLLLVDAQPLCAGIDWMPGESSQRKLVAKLGTNNQTLDVPLSQLMPLARQGFGPGFEAINLDSIVGELGASALGIVPMVRFTRESATSGRVGVWGFHSFQPAALLLVLPSLPPAVGSVITKTQSALAVNSNGAALRLTITANELNLSMEQENFGALYVSNLADTARVNVTIDHPAKYLWNINGKVSVDTVTIQVNEHGDLTYSMRAQPSHTYYLQPQASACPNLVKPQWSEDFWATNAKQSVAPLQAR